MSKNKHLSLDDRSKIQLMLDNKESFSSIASSLGKDPSTISPSLGFSTIFFESLIYIELLPVSIFAGFFVV